MIQPVERNLRPGSLPAGSETTHSETGFLQSLQPAAPLTIQRNAEGELVRFGPLTVDFPIGSGGFGTVFRARNPRSQEFFALKIPGERTLARGHAETVAHVLQEGRVRAEINGTPHTVALLDFGSVEGLPFLLSRLVRGRSLQYLVDTRTHVRPVEFMAAIGRAMRGVAVVHAQSIVHGDIKPANILLDVLDKQVFITDFGNAARVGESVNPHSLLHGSPAFVAPEQLGALENNAITPATDVYSFGTTLFYLFSEEAFHPGATNSQIIRAVIRGETLPEERWKIASQRLRELLRRALARQPADRFQDLESFHQALSKTLPETRSEDQLIEQLSAKLTARIRQNVRPGTE